jgi:hypothetical protein
MFGLFIIFLLKKKKKRQFSYSLNCFSFLRTREQIRVFKMLTIISCSMKYLERA